MRKTTSIGQRKTRTNKDGSRTISEKTSSGWKKVSRQYNVGAGPKKKK